MSRVLFGINIAAIQKIRDLDLLHLTLTFDLDIWPWDWSTITLMLWRKHYKNVLFWRHVTQKRHLICYNGDHPNDFSILSVNILQPTRSLYGFRFKSYGSKGDFHGFWCVWPWPWNFKVIWFLWIHHLFPCKTGVNFEAISSLIAEI